AVANDTASDTQAITVNVTDVNEAPQITSGDAFVPENDTAATNIVAFDPHAGTLLGYVITGGADAARFHINELTGALSFKHAPDFEHPVDADHDNKYEVVVRVFDGTSFDEKALTITVTDVAEPPPLVTTWGDEFLINTTT